MLVSIGDIESLKVGIKKTLREGVKLRRIEGVNFTMLSFCWFFRR